MPCLTVLALSLLFSAPPGAEVNKAVERVFADESIQREYPSGTTRPRDEEPKRDGGFRGFGPAGEALAWVLAAVAVLLGLFWLYRRLSGFQRNVVVPRDPTASAPDATEAVAGGADTEALAAAGRFAEAIHGLLIRAFARLGDGAVIDSSTSREVLAQARIPAAARDALTRLVGAVELSLFGGRDADAAQYRSSVDHFETFASNLRGSSA